MNGLPLEERTLSDAQLGGLHSNAYISDLFARDFAKTGMKAYVELIQRREREMGTDVLTHQKVELFPLSVVNRGADTA